MTPRERLLRRSGVVIFGAAVLAVAFSLADRQSVERANRLYHAGDLESAVARYERSADNDPAVAYNLGTALMGLDPDSAGDVLRRAAETEVRETRKWSLYNLGFHLITRLGGLMTQDSIRMMLEEAVAANRLALRLDPADDDVRWNLAVAQRRLDAMVPPGEETGRESSGESDDEIAMNNPELARSEDSPAESGLEPEDPRAADNQGERSGPRQGAREAWATQDPGPISPTDARNLLVNLNDEPELLLRGILWSHRPDVAWWSGQPYPGGRW
jgi:tetratricopeptide (TPR) repeat protein